MTVIVRRLFRSSLVRFALVLVLAVSGCGPSVSDLPVVPAVDYGELREVVHDQLEAAYAMLEARPRSSEAAAELGMVLHAYERYAAAEVAYRRALMLEPKSARYVYLRGVVLAEQGRSDEAVSAFRRVLELAPDDPRAAARLLALLIDRGEIDEASVLAVDFRRRHLRDAELAFLQAKILALLGRHEQATTLYAELLGRDIRAPAVLYGAGQAARARGDLEAAAALLDEFGRTGGGAVRSRWPDPLLDEIRRRELTATSQVRHAQRLVDQGAPLEQVVEILERAVELDPEAYEAHISLVGLYGRLGDFSKVDEHYAEALALAPDVAQLHFNLGLARLRQRSLSEARRALERAVELEPRNAMARAVLGQVVFELGFRDAGIDGIERAIASRPEDPAVREIHAVVLLQSQRFEEVLETLSAVPASPQRRIARLALRASAYSGLRDDAAAVESLEAAAAIADEIGSADQARALRQAAGSVESG